MEDSLIGKEVTTLDGKTITIKNEKKINGETIFVDTDGNIYTEGELNLYYMVNPSYLLFEALLKYKIVKRSDWKQGNNNFDVAFGTFMESMVKAGFIINNEEEK